MDDNTTTVLLAAIIFAPVFAILWRFAQVSLHLERLNLNLLGWLKFSIGVLKVTLQKRPEVNMNSPYRQGGFALGKTMIVPGNHDIDLFVLTHADDDHRHGFRHFLKTELRPS